MSVTSQKLKNNTTTANNENVWTVRLGRMTEMLLHNCLSQNFHKNHHIATLLRNCLKQKIMEVLNRILHYDVIQILDGVKLVKIRDAKSNFSR